MHESSMLRMKWFKDSYLKNSNEKQVMTILDVGSQCVSEQLNTYKVFFSESQFKYIGLDMVDGYNVDMVVKSAYKWDEIPNNFCDVIISGQMFEHVEFPWLTMSEMARVLKPQGVICIIVPSMQILHRFPVNCQNYFSDGLIALAKYAGLETLHASTNYAPEKAGIEWYNIHAQDSMLIAQKPIGWEEYSFNKENYICEVADLEKMATGLIPMEKQKWYKMYTIKQHLKHVKKAVLLPYYIYKTIVNK